jgi:hypothetical protein
MKRLLGLLLTACALLPGRAADSHPSARGWPWKSGAQTLIIDGRERTFLLDVAEHLQPGAALLLVFHGFTDSAQGVRRTSGFTALAENHGFVAAYPQGTCDARGNTFFNVGYSFHEVEKVDDVRFARELSARLRKYRHRRCRSKQRSKAEERPWPGHAFPRSDSQTTRPRRLARPRRAGPSCRRRSSQRQQADSQTSLLC